jgi:glycine C-acetyltransferase
MKNLSVPGGDSSAALRPDRLVGAGEHDPEGIPSGSASGGLLDFARARRMLERVSWAIENGLYTYQMPLTGRSGAWVDVAGQSRLMLSSYDYLGLIGHPAIQFAAADAIRQYGTGTGGVRLLSGTTDLHRQLEAELAAFKGTEAAITYSSGYAANLSIIGALFGPRDYVLVDQKAHRSIRDACRLAGTRLRAFTHNDPGSLEDALRSIGKSRRVLVATDAVFSMDGDICPLPDYVELKKKYGFFLLIDEAHSLGVLGATGRGIHEHFDLPVESVDLWMGTLSKTIPATGGYLAGSRELVIYLQHTSPSWIFSAALCPGSAAAAREALRIVDDEPERHDTMVRNAARFRDGIRSLGFAAADCPTPIVPLPIGGMEDAYRFSRALLDAGVIALPVTYPAVPKGKAILRLCPTAAHSESDLALALQAIAAVRGEVHSD